MNRYEVLMLAVPEVTQDESKQIEQQLDTIARSTDGSLISFERWGKYKLAYPVDSNDYGVYFLARFESNQPNMLDEVNSLFKIKLNDVVMRNQVNKLDANQTLVYNRPKSLEDAPETSNARGFMDERKKIEGLISAVESKKKLEGTAEEDLEQNEDSE